MFVIECIKKGFWECCSKMIGIRWMSLDNIWRIIFSSWFESNGPCFFCNCLRLYFCKDCVDCVYLYHYVLFYGLAWWKLCRAQKTPGLQTFYCFYLIFTKLMFTDLKLRVFLLLLISFEFCLSQNLFRKIKGLGHLSNSWQHGRRFENAHWSKSRRQDRKGRIQEENSNQISHP